MDFLTCKICGTRYTDKCELNIWQEHTPDDKPTDTYMMICKSDACQKWIDDAPLPYVELPWAAGGPGKFTLLCGFCKYRDGFTCTHPNLTTNGGTGLLVETTPHPLGNVTVCTDRGCFKLPSIATKCEGLPE